MTGKKITRNISGDGVNDCKEDQSLASYFVSNVYVAPNSYIYRKSEMKRTSGFVQGIKATFHGGHSAMPFPTVKPLAVSIPMTSELTSDQILQKDAMLASSLKKIRYFEKTQTKQSKNRQC